MAPNVVLRSYYAVPEQQILSKNMPLEKKAMCIKRRKYLSSGQYNDYLKYIDTGVAEGDYLKYSGSREKSSGVFNTDGLLNKPKRQILRQQLRATESNVWDFVISFEEEFGEKYMQNHEDARELLNAELPRFFKRIGLNPDNIEWYAGLHENTDNRHLHLSFFEKQPLFISARDSSNRRYRYGKISTAAFEEFKINIEARLLDISFQLGQSRRKFTSESKNRLKKAVTSYSDEDIFLRKMLLELYRKMPTEGRVSYDSLNIASLRTAVNEIVNHIIRKDKTVKKAFDGFCTELVIRDKQIIDICNRQKVENATRFLVEDKYINDIYRRLGDQVIQAAIAIKRKEKRELKKVKSELARKRIEKRHRGYLFERAANLSADVNDNAIRIFEEYRNRLREAEFDRLVDEGEIDLE